MEQPKQSNEEKPNKKSKAKIIRNLDVNLEFLDDGEFNIKIKNNPPLSKEFIESLASKNKNFKLDDSLASVMLMESINKAIHATLEGIATSEKKSYQTTTEE